MNSARFLSVVRIQEQSKVLGPGVRMVIWFHGCQFSCPGCIAEEMNQSRSAENFTPEALAARVATVKGIEGVTLSGGDPLDQPLESLAEFVEQIQGRGLSVMCYTGRRYEDLLAALKTESSLARILDCVDLLVDGLYIERLNQGAMWRGSSNQRLHFLSLRYRHLESWANASQERGIEATVSAAGRLEVTGIPSAGFINRLREELQSRGLKLDFNEEREDE